MNLNKSRDYFDPSTITSTCHLIGCGAVGSTLAETLARMGIEKFTLWDFDVVMPHNLANQMFLEKHIGTSKAEATKSIILSVNPLAEVTIKEVPYTSQNLSGYVFLGVDSVDTRRSIVEQHMNNIYIKAIFDFRMRLTDAQHYGADWSIKADRENLLSTMQFTHEEAQEQTPVSACGTTLNVAPTVKIIVALGVTNFVRFIKYNKIHKLILMNLDDIEIDAM